MNYPHFPSRTVLTLLVCAFLACGTSRTTPTRAAEADLMRRAQLYHREVLPSGWTCAVRAPGSAPHTFWLALKQQNVEDLEMLLRRVSDPLSPEYGQYRSVSEIENMVMPNHEERGKVFAWLKSTAVAVNVQDTLAITDFGDALEVTANVAFVEAAFQTRVHLCSHSSQEALLFPKALGSISIPAHLGVVQFVTGLSDFFHPESHRLTFKEYQPRAQPDQVQNNNYVYPVTTRILNEIPSTARVTHPLATQGVVEFGLVVPHETGQDGGGGGGFQFSDLEYFSKIAELPFHNVTNIVGPFTQNNLTGNAESLLDTEYILAIAPNADTTYSTYLVWMFEFAEKLFHDSAAPLVNSLSYATAENLMCNTTLNGTPNKGCQILGVDAAGYIARANLEFVKLGIRGISLISASGDNGAPSENNKLCEKDHSKYPLYPLFPASSPHVTAVGGIALVEQVKGKPDSPQPPICASSNAGAGFCGGKPFTLAASNRANGGITTGGGFSNYTEQPWYQKEAVASFLASEAYRPPQNVFNKENRAYPDVANLATNILIVENKKTLLGAGTSASTPMIAAIATLVNSHLLSKGLPPLGFMNPLIYHAAKEDPSIFIDVTQGNNTCTELACCKYGYQAAPGWDPVTGFGAINYPNLLAFVDRFWDARNQQKTAHKH